jgi:DNA-binding transcriptional MerR regulator
MKIGELAEQSGMAPSKIRFLESRGLLGKVSRQSNGYREYADEALDVLKIVASAQQAGFTLEEIQRVLPHDLATWEHDGLMAALEGKIAGIERIERQLADSKKALRELIRQIQTRPEGIDCAENAKRLIRKMAKPASGKKK